MNQQSPREPAELPVGGSGGLLKLTLGRVVILPFFGEFGHFVMHFVRVAQQLRATEKVVCCRKGDEILFPDAADFFYDWEQPFRDEERCGFRDRWEFGGPIEETIQEQALNRSLAARFPNHERVRVEHLLSPEEIAAIPLKLGPLRYTAKTPDVVLGARRRHPVNSREDSSMRNWPHWSTLVDKVQGEGYTVGLVGQAGTTALAEKADLAKSWEHPSNLHAMIGMLSDCRVYVGTDTGPTHLAAAVANRLVVFRLEDGSPDYLSTAVAGTCRRRGMQCTLLEDGWDQPANVVDAVLAELREYPR